MARPDGTKLIASNRRARRNYEVLETVEAGLVLRGSEVKSLRLGHVQMSDAYGRFEGGEVWLQSLHIAVYEQSQAHSGHEPERPRKLLLHREEIARLRSKVDEQRLSLVPLSIYFKDGRAKVDLALARGRKTYDKRHLIAERDAARDADRAISRARSGRHD
jgi:SsrA-binding protein